MNDKVSSEAAMLIRQLAEPVSAGRQSVKALLRKAFYRLRTWRMSRVKAVWYADRRIKVSGEELDYLRAAARVAKDEARDPELAKIAADVAVLKERLERLDREIHLPPPEIIRGASRPARK